jgi:type II secretory pathway pseudopilin PulG
MKGNKNLGEVKPMKILRNQGLTSFDVLTIMFSFGVIIAVAAPIMRNNMEAVNIETAHQVASQLANQLSQYKYSKTQEKSAQRGIASVSQSDMEAQEISFAPGQLKGEGGKDPWGRPFQYEFVRDSKNETIQVAVWSNGPNGKDDTKNMSIRDLTKVPGDIFKGDDLGSLVPVR